MITTHSRPKFHSKAKLLLELLRVQWLCYRGLIGLLIAIQILMGLLEFNIKGNYISTPSQTVENWLLGILFLLFCIAVLVFIARLANGDSPNSLDGNKGNGSAYPTYMLTLPVSDKWLVVVPMLFGSFTVAAVLGFNMLLHITDKEHVQIAWMLNPAASVVCLQAITWSRIRGAWSKVVLGSIIVIGGIANTIGASLDHGNQFALGSIGLSVLAFVFATLTFNRLRHGFPEWISKITSRPWGRRASRMSPPLRSPMQAQIALDWSRQGKTVPIFAFILAPTFLYFNVLREARIAPYEHDGTMGISMLLLLALFSFCAGSTPRRGEIFRLDFGLQPFIVTKPVSSTQMAWSKLIVAGISSLVSWLLVAALFIFWMLVPLQNNGAFLKIAGHRLSFDSPQETVFFVTAFLITLVLLWNTQSALFTTEVSGKRWLSVIYLFGVTATIILFLINHDIQHREIWLPLLAALAIAAKLVIAGISAFRLVMRRETGWSQVIAIGSTWVAVTLALVIAFLLSAPEDMSDRGLVAACIVIFVPLARIFAAPLTLAMNRHQSFGNHSATKGKRTTTVVY